MSQLPLIDVVVPVRDHAASLGPLLRALPHRSIRSVVVVDRASTDRSGEVARDLGALVLREASGGYGAACRRATAHFSTLPRAPDVVVFLPGDRASVAPFVVELVAPIAARGVELVLGLEPGRPRLMDRLVTAAIDTVYRHRFAGVSPVRAIRFPALVALGMADRRDGWDIEMLVRATTLGLTCEELALPSAQEPSARPRAIGRALFHILRHATMR